MYQANTSVDHHLTELYQVAADLRAARANQASGPQHGPNPIRMALGRAFLGLGFALVAVPRRSSVHGA
jgi:hypothetical protein